MKKLVSILLAFGLLVVWATPVAALSAEELLVDGGFWGENSSSTGEFVAAGSKVVASRVQIHTEAKAATTNAPRLSFSISADGEGAVSAGMEVRSLGGLAAGGALSSVQTFSDYAAASGVWTFAKVMSYNSVVSNR